MLQESLQRDSRDNARWEEYNRAAARMLQTLYPSRRRGLSARIGLHLFEGREADNAIEPLLSGAQDAESAGQISQALHLLSIREECQDIIRCAKDDPSRISGHLLRACVQIQAGEYDQAHDSANAAADSAKRTANPTQRADALGWLAHIHHLRGKYDEALAAYTQKKTLSEHVDYTQGMANALLGIGSIYLARGEYGEARNAYRLAYEQYELIDENKGMGRSVYGMAVAASKEGDLPGSDAFNRRAMKLFEGCGSLDGVALCMNGIAESARFQGDLSSAEQGYRRAASMFEALGSSNEIVMRMNVALVLLGRNRFEEALTELKPIEQHLADQRPNVFLPFVYSQLLASYAHLQLWSLWETSLALFKEVIEEVDALDRDIAYPLQISAEQCVKHGRKDYAKLAYELSLDQWDRIGNLKAKNLVQLALQAIS